MDKELFEQALAHQDESLEECCDIAESMIENLQLISISKKKSGFFSRKISI